MIVPKDIPTTVGDKVRPRGLTRVGIVEWMRGNWCGVNWDDGSPTPSIRHVNELQKVDPTT